MQYLRVCPLPEAKEHLVELAKIDPDAVKRANSFFPIAGPTNQTAGQDPKATVPTKDDAPADAKEFDGQPGKFDAYFSAEPGEGD